MDQWRTRPDLKDDGIPDGLAQGLRHAFGNVPDVAPGFDKRVLAAAGRRLSRRTAHRITGLRLSAGAGIAAMIGLSAILWFAPLGGHAPSVARMTTDINHDGRVDVLDAMALAISVKTGQGRGTDLNGDARIDEADVRLLTARVVSLTQARPGTRGQGGQG